MQLEYILLSRETFTQSGAVFALHMTCCISNAMYYHIFQKSGIQKESNLREKADRNGDKPDK